MKRWHVLHVAPAPADRLVLRALGHLRIPLYQFTRLRRRPKRKPLREEIFPGYLFVEFDAADLSWRALPRIPGVLRLFSSPAGVPLALPEGEMERLIQTFATAKTWERRSLVTGDEVTVRSGPLNRFGAVVEWANDRQVGLTFSIFGRSSQVILGIDQVERKESRPEEV